MFLYFNKQGQLDTTITEPPFRVGNKNANVIYAIFDKQQLITNATIRLQFNEQRIPEVQFPMEAVKPGECVLRPEDFEYGTNTKIGRLKWNYDYSTDPNVTVLKYTFANRLLIKGKCIATIIGGNGFAQGKITFYIEDNLLSVTELSEDEEYQNVLDMLNNKVDWDDNSYNVKSIGVSQKFLVENNYDSFLDYVNFLHNFICIDKNNFNTGVNYYDEYVKKQNPIALLCDKEEKTFVISKRIEQGIDYVRFIFEEPIVNETTSDTVITRYSYTCIKNGSLSKSKTKYSLATKQYIEDNYYNKTQVDEIAKSITIHDKSELDEIKTDGIYRIIEDFSPRNTTLVYHLFVEHNNETIFQTRKSFGHYYTRVLRNGTWTEWKEKRLSVNGVTDGTGYTGTFFKGSIFVFSDRNTYISLEEQATTPSENPSGWQDITKLVSSDLLGQPDGIATLDSNSIIKESQLPKWIKNIIFSENESTTGKVLKTIRVGEDTWKIEDGSKIILKTINNESLKGSGNISLPTEARVLTLINDKLSATFTYKGSKPSKSEFPKTGNKIGDVWDAQDTGINSAWNGNEWDDLGGFIDLSKYATIEYVNGKIQDLEHDKLDVITYVVASGTITQQDAATIINNFALYDGKQIQFLTNTESPNKQIAIGYVLMTNEGDKLLFELNSNGIVTEWNSSTHKPLFDGTKVIANPSLIGSEGALTSIEINGVKYKLAATGGNKVVANSDKPTTQELNTLEVDNVNYKINKVGMSFSDKVSTSGTLLNTITINNDDGTEDIWKIPVNDLTEDKVNILIDNKQLIPLSQKGATNGVATLGSDGKVPSSQLPDGIDEIIEGKLTNTTTFTAANGTVWNSSSAGVDKKIFVDTKTNKSYRWSGTQFTVIASDLALGETSETAYAGNKGKANALAIKDLQDDVNHLITVDIVNLDQDKVDKIKQQYMLYGTNGLGDQTEVQYNQEPYGNGVAQRTSDGRLKGKAPTENNDLVNLEYFINNKGGDVAANNGQPTTEDLSTLLVNGINYNLFNVEMSFSDKIEESGTELKSISITNGTTTDKWKIPEGITQEQVENTITSKGYQTSSQVNSIIDSKKLQPQLVSGTNVKTLNGESILGSGNLEISGGGNLFFKPYIRTITFKISGTPYQAKENMTWEQWCASKYNNGSFSVVNTNVYFYYDLGKPRQDLVCRRDSISFPVFNADIIQENFNYFVIIEDYDVGGGTN